MTDFQAENAAVLAGLKHRDIDLSSARDNELILFSGSTRLYIAQDAFDSETVLSTTLSVGHAFARFGENTNSPVILKKGRAYALDPTSRIYLTNSAQANKMMRVYHSVGPVILPYASEIEVIGDVASTNFSDTDLTIATANVDTITAITGQKEIHITTDQVLRWGDDVATAKGAEIPVGTTVLAYSGDVKLRNDSGATATVKYTQIGS